MAIICHPGPGRPAAGSLALHRVRRRSPSPARGRARPGARRSALPSAPRGPLRAPPDAGERPGREGLSPPSLRLPRAAAAAAAGAGARGRAGGGRGTGCGCRGDFLCRPPPPPPRPGRCPHGRRPAGRTLGRAGERTGTPARRRRPPPARGRRALGTCGRRRTLAGPGLPRAEPKPASPGPCRPQPGPPCLVRPGARGAREGPARPALSPALDPGSAPSPRQRPTPLLLLNSVLSLNARSIMGL